MENFGDRLSVNDIWRVVLFIKTIPNGTLRKDYVPQPSDYIVWQPSKELLAWTKTRQKLADNVAFSKRQASDPFVQEALRVMPGLSPGDSFLINDGKTRLSLPDAAAGIKAIYEDLLNRAWDEARARGEQVARRVAEGDSAHRAGAAMRRAPRPPIGLVVFAGARAARGARSRMTSPRRTQSRWVMADWMMDMFFVFSGPRARRVPRGLEVGCASTSSTRTRRSRSTSQEEDYYTPEWALSEEEWQE